MNYKNLKESWEIGMFAFAFGGSLTGNVYAIVFLIMTSGNLYLSYKMSKETNNTTEGKEK